MGGPPLGELFFQVVYCCWVVWGFAVGLFWDIFWLFWVLEGVVFDDFDWDPILVVFCLFRGLVES